MARKFKEVVPVAGEELVTESTGKKWKVTFPDCPELVMEADDKSEAWDKFKKHCGILETIHVPTITPVVEE